VVTPFNIAKSYVSHTPTRSPIRLDDSTVIEGEQNMILHFNPQPPNPMVIACVWSHWRIVRGYSQNWTRLTLQHHSWFREHRRSLGQFKTLKICVDGLISQLPAAQEHYVSRQYNHACNANYSEDPSRLPRP
jgi:hypothetical protein